MRARGFTLIESMVVVAILAILAALVVPRMQNFGARRAMSAALDTLAADYRFTRTEALKRSTTVTICRSTNQTSCAGAGDWSVGWIVFVDAGTKGSVDTGDAILRVQGAVPGILSIGQSALTGTLGYSAFEATGRTQTSANQTYILTPIGSQVTIGTRLMCISAQGRPSVRVEGTNSCA